MESDIRSRTMRKLANNQKLTPNEFILASCAIETRAGDVLKASKQLLRDCEACLPKNRTH
jgi:hypothetical protein